jgi:hypothetical protein
MAFKRLKNQIYPHPVHPLKVFVFKPGSREYAVYTPMTFPVLYEINSKLQRRRILI